VDTVESLVIDWRDGSLHGEGALSELFEVVESLEVNVKESGKMNDCELSVESLVIDWRDGSSLGCQMWKEGNLRCEIWVESLEVDRREGSIRGGMSKEGNLGWLIAVVEFLELDE
jgi:hypothetical protein